MTGFAVPALAYPDFSRRTSGVTIMTESHVRTITIQSYRYRLIIPLKKRLMMIPFNITMRKMKIH